MAEMNKIQSFKTFSQLKAEEKEIQLQEEAKGKREQLVTKIGETLAEMDITSFDELSEEQKKALVAKLFNEEIKEVEVEAEESKAEKSIEEGNAFIFAAAKAKAEGKEDFEFNGKSYKVTLKKDTGLKESVQLLITEATRWQFGIIDKTGKIESNYVHYDGYPSSVLPQIKGMNAKEVRSILKDSEMGGMSTLENPYNDSKESTITTGTVKNIKKYLKDIENSAGAEYVYLFDEKSGKWVGADTYVDKALKPVDQIEESVVTEANYSLSKLEDMGFKAGEDYFEKVKGLLKNGPDLKAYKKGFTQGFVDNAAAYGVKESVVNEATKPTEVKAAEKALKLKSEEHFDLDGVWLIGAQDKVQFQWSSEYGGYSVGDENGTELYNGTDLKAAVKAYKKAINESVNEAEIKSDDEFKEYAETVLKKAFGEDYDENKAGDVIDGLISKYSSDYGAMVGALQSSLD